MTSTTHPETPPVFGPGLFAFLRELAAHNDREWFTPNKARFETEVRDPALRFVRTIAPGLGRLSRHLVADPRPVGGSVSRIYRDIRFSRDKSPYKTNVGIHFSHENAAAHEGGLPGLYLHFQPGTCYVAGGAWHPAAPDLQKVRDSISKRPTDWQKAGPKGVEIEGESLKRVPPGYDADHPFADDLRRKEFLASYPLSEKEVTSPKFSARFLELGRALDPFNRFLAKAIGIPW